MFDRFYKYAIYVTDVAIVGVDAVVIAVAVGIYDDDCVVVRYFRYDCGYSDYRVCSIFVVVDNVLSPPLSLVLVLLLALLITLFLLLLFIILLLALSP